MSNVKCECGNTPDEPEHDTRCGDCQFLDHLADIDQHDWSDATIGGWSMASECKRCGKRWAHIAQSYEDVAGSCVGVMS